MGGTLKLADDWRKTGLSWRASVGESNVGTSPGFWPGPAAKKPERLGISDGAMAVEPHFGFDGPPSGPAHDAGLRPGGVIVAVNGERPDLAHRPWLIWFRLKYDPGDEITLTVQTTPGEAKQVTYRPK